MNKFSYFIAFSALVFLLGAAACSGQQAAPTTSAEATALASGLTMPSSGTSTVIIGSPGTDTTGSGTDTGGANTQQPQQPVVVTGGSASLLCQFCVDQIAHAVVVLPQTASFELSAPADGSPTAGTSCNAIEEINGKKIVVCYGAPGTSFEMKVCTGDTCSQFPVKFDSCPVNVNKQPEAAATATLPATGTAGTTATTESTAIPSATP